MYFCRITISMRIGIVAATEFEIRPVIDFIQQQQAGSLHEFVVLITGIGILSTTYHLTEQLRQGSFSCLLQAGIGGCFSEKFWLADVVLIQEEVVGDLGVEEDEFKDIFDMGFAKAGQFPFTGKTLPNPYMNRWKKFKLPVTNGITVNEITTQPKRITTLRRKYGSGIESMEGAAFHYVCLHHAVPFLQLRSVSNYVGERDKTKWKLPEAIAALNVQLISIIKQLTDQ